MEFPDAIYRTGAEYNRATGCKLYDLNDLGASRNCFSRALQSLFSWMDNINGRLKMCWSNECYM